MIILRFCSQGLSDYQEAYSPYPNAHLCLRYVIEVGKVIFLDDDLDPGEMKEAESHDRSHFTQSATGSQGGRSVSMLKFGAYILVIFSFEVLKLRVGRPISSDWFMSNTL